MDIYTIHNMDNSEKPFISFITCVYNGEKYIEKLILSIQEQWDDDIEHIIIDDGSTDNTLEIIKKYPSIQWWSRENRGLYYSMNEGIEKASGEYICLIHSDDQISPNSINIIKEAIRMNRFPDGIYGNIQCIDENGFPLPVQNLIKQGGLWVYKYFHHISHCSLYIKKEFLNSNQIWFDSNLKCAADYEWFIKILQKKINLFYIGKYLSQSRVHENQVSTRMTKIANQEQELLHKKYRVNENLFRFIWKSMVIRAGFIRLFWEWRMYGFTIVYRRIKTLVTQKKI